MKKMDFLDQGRLKSQGFTLVELIIALVICLVVMSGIYAYSNSHHKSHVVQTRVNEMNQNIRVALNKMVTEIRMAGFKTGSDTSDIMTQTALWTKGLIPNIPYTIVMNKRNPIITEGSTNPDDDMIMFIYGETVPTTLAYDAPIPSTKITLSLNGTQTARRFNIGDIIYIGFGSVQSDNLEYAKIVSISGSQLFIDTDLTKTLSQPLDFFYRSGTEVGLMNVVTYAVFNDENDPSYSQHDKGLPILKRRCNRGSMEGFVEGIESLDIQYIDTDNDDIRITVVARTSKEDPEYTNPDFGDHYRRRTLNSIVQVRNR